MVATQNYADAVRTAVEAGVDAIVSGAGLPLELPGLVEKADVALAPIVSSGRAAKLILRRWAKASTVPPTSWSLRAARPADTWLFGRRASGRKMPDSRRDPAEVLAEVKLSRLQFGHDIPVFVAGGVYTARTSPTILRWVLRAHSSPPASSPPTSATQPDL